MEKVTLKLVEFYNLETELNGAFNQQANQLIIRGLLNETIKLSTKIKLTDLLKKVQVEIEAINSKRNELVEKHGEKQEDGSFLITPFINIQTNEQGEITSREDNPKFQEFQQELQAFLQEEKEFEFEPFTSVDLEGAYSEFNYVQFYKLVKLDQ
jgi:biopolymer transport protein ExbD